MVSCAQKIKLGKARLAYLVDASADDFLDAAIPGGRDSGAPLVLVQLLAHVLHRCVRALVVPQGEKIRSEKRFDGFC